MIENLIQYLLSKSFLIGVWNTFKLTILAMLLAIILGFIVALLRNSNNIILKSLSGAYIWIFRGIPILVLLIFVFNALPQLGLKMNVFQSALVALVLNETAYMAEIVRSGILSVDEGQRRAARGLGMNRFRVMRYITLPQAVRIVTPPTANQFIAMLKNSAMASVIGYSDLLLTAQETASANFDYISTLFAAVIYYLLITALFTWVQSFLENRMSISKKIERINRKTAKRVAVAESH